MENCGRTGNILLSCSGNIPANTGNIRALSTDGGINSSPTRSGEKLITTTPLVVTLVDKISISSSGVGAKFNTPERVVLAVLLPIAIIRRGTGKSLDCGLKSFVPEITITPLVVGGDCFNTMMYQVFLNIKDRMEPVLNTIYSSLVVLSCIIVSSGSPVALIDQICRNNPIEPLFTVSSAFHK